MDVVALGPDEAGHIHDDLAGDWEGDGDGPGVGGEDEAGPPASFVEDLNDVVGMEVRRGFQSRGPQVDMGGANCLMSPSPSKVTLYCARAWRPWVAAKSTTVGSNQMP